MDGNVFDPHPWRYAHGCSLPSPSPLRDRQPPALACEYSRACGSLFGSVRCPIQCHNRHDFAVRAKNSWQQFSSCFYHQYVPQTQEGGGKLCHWQWNCDCPKGMCCLWKSQYRAKVMGCPHTHMSGLLFISLGLGKGATPLYNSHNFPIFSFIWEAAAPVQAEWQHLNGKGDLELLLYS